MCKGVKLNDGIDNNIIADTINNLLSELDKLNDNTTDLSELIKSFNTVKNDVKQSLEYIVEQWKTGNIIIDGDNGPPPSENDTIQDLTTRLEDTQSYNEKYRIYAGKRKSKVKISNR